MCFTQRFDRDLHHALCQILQAFDLLVPEELLIFLRQRPTELSIIDGDILLLILSEDTFNTRLKEFYNHLMEKGPVSPN